MLRDVSSVKICEAHKGVQLVLGQGVTGVVYKGVLDSTIVAVKQFHNNLSLDIIEYELNILKGLRHDNIVRVVGADIPQRRIVFEYCERGSLRNLMKSKEFCDEVRLENRGASIIKGILTGVEYLHSQNVLHLDFKSDNVLLDSNWVVKIADVGLARNMDERSIYGVVTHNVKFTKNWAPPESYEKPMRLTKASDIYAVGMTIYEIISGDVPFKGYEKHQLKEAVTTGVRPEIPPTCPVIVKQMIVESWSGDAAQRPDITTLKKMIQKYETQHYLQLINASAANATVYFNLGVSLSLGGIIQLLDKSTLTQQQLFLKAIDLDPNYANAYYNLGRTIPVGGSIQLLNGTMLSQQQIYLKAIELDPNHAAAYNNLANSLTRGNSITLNDGTKMSQQQLFLKAIDLNPNLSTAYYNLGCSISFGDSVVLGNKTTMTQQQLFLKAIDINPKYASAYYALACALFPGGSIQLNNGIAMTQQQLYMKVIDLNPNHSNAFISLGTTLLPGENIQLLNGKKMSQQELYLTAISLNPYNSNAYHYLGTTLSHENESITLRDGTTMTTLQLYLKCLDINPDHTGACKSLAAFTEDSIRLLNGTVLTKQELQEKAIGINSKAIFAPPALQASRIMGQEDLYHKEGYCWKVGGKKGEKWQKRWFVLQKATLCYYRNQNSSNPKGLVPLSYITKVERVTLKKKQFTFAIEVPGRRYYIAALSEEEQESWIWNIQSYLQFVHQKYETLS